MPGIALRSNVWLAAGVAAVTIACFAPAIPSEFLDWDDRANLLENEAWRGLSWSHLRWMATAFHQGHWHPLTWLSFALDHAIWGLNPTGYHLTNVLLHAANTVLVFFLMRTMLAPSLSPSLSLPRSLSPSLSPSPSLSLLPEGGNSLWAAAAGALFFAVHPLRAESVVWVTERRDVLSGFFLLSSLLAWLRMQREGGPTARPAFYLLSLVLFAASLASKAWGITFPVVLAVLDLWPLGRRVRILEKIPFAALAAGAAYLALAAQSSSAEMAGLAAHSASSRVAQAVFGIAYYVRATVLPIHLAPLHPLHPPVAWQSPAVIGSAAAVGVVALVLWAIRRRAPAIVAAFAVYLVVVSPVLGFAQTGPQLVANRYSYLACIPLAMLGGAALAFLYELRQNRVRGGAPSLTRRGIAFLAPALAIAALAPLILFTIRETAHWRTSRALWDHAVAARPDAEEAWVHRAESHFLAGDFAAAASDADRALSLDPGNSGAHMARGNALLARGDARGALADFDAAVIASPALAAARNNRGGARLALGDAPGAIPDFDEAIRLDPNLGKAWFNRGRAKRITGPLDAALADFDRSISLDPGEAAGFNSRGDVRFALGDIAGAIADFEVAIRLDPKSAIGWNNLANALAKKGDLNNAVIGFNRAVALDPREPALRMNRARVRAAMGDTAGAIEDYEGALAIAPPNWSLREPTLRALGAAKAANMQPSP